MSDVFDNSAETTEPSGAATFDDKPSTETAAPAADHRDLSELLAEFDKSEKSANGSHKPATEGKPTPPGGGDLESIRAEQARLAALLQAAPKGLYDSPELLGLAMKIDGIAAFTDAAMERVSAQEQQRAAEDRARLEQEDKTRVVAYAREQLDGLDVPEGWDMRWLASEHAINPEVSTAWKNRYASPEAEAHAERVVKDAVKRMVKDAKAQAGSRIDLNATEDRALVSAAVRGSGSKVPSEDPRAYAQRVNRMSDFEFAQHKSQLMDG